MLNENFVILAVILNCAGTLSYLVGTLKGKVKPNRVTWFVWALAPLIAFAAEVGQGVGIVALATFAAGFNPAVIFLASFVNKKSEWKLGRLDIACGVLSLIGLALWQVTKVGNLAIMFSILADAAASVPTVIKSYFEPETENYQAYLLAAISFAITLLAINVWTPEYYAFPLYALLVCALLFVLIKFKLGRMIRRGFAASKLY